jgi:RNA polymerase sigma-70 factor (ECF subfamily)
MTDRSNAEPGDGIQLVDTMLPDGEGLGMTAAALPVHAEQTDVALAVRGDGAAFERLYRAHVARVNALARWLLGGDDVEDAVQEVFIRVWEKLGTYSGDAAFGTWLHRVAVNHFLRRRERRSVHHGRTSEGDQAMDSAAAPRATPDLRIAIERAVGQLPARARDVFVLHDMEGYKHEEIAGMLAIDPGTSRSQLHRARLLLRQQLTS